MQKKLITAILSAVLVVAMAATVFAGTWKQDAKGWKYDNGNGSLSKSTWQWIDAKCYCFDKDGYMYANTTTPDGYTVNADGAWTVNGTVQTQSTSTAGKSASSTDERLKYFNEKYGFSANSPEYLKTWSKTFANTQTCSELKKFLTSIDWPNMSEMDRLEACFKRCATGYNGNAYGASTYMDQEDTVLVHKIGICHNYASTLSNLCNLVGLEACEDLRPYHEITRVKVDGVWYVVDPTWAEGQPLSTVFYRLDDPKVNELYGASEGTK